MPYLSAYQYHFGWGATGRLVVLISCVLAVYACGVRKTVQGVGDGGAPSMPISAFVSEFAKHNTLPDHMESRGSFTLHSAESRLSMGHRTIISPHQSVMLSIRPMGLIEVAKIQVTQKETMVIDKLNKLLYLGDNELLSDSLRAHITGLQPELLWALLLNAPFDDKTVGGESLEAMSLVWKDKMAIFSKQIGEVEIEHQVDGQKYQLLRSVVRHSSGVVLQMDYSHFRLIESEEGNHRAFPHEIQLSLHSPTPMVNMNREGKMPQRIVLWFDQLRAMSTTSKPESIDHYTESGYRIVPLLEWSKDILK